jgi:lipopolysaccharide biosynthesis glycosyltransferase
MNEFAIYTVCTGHYKYGLFALIKSLRKLGYNGKIIVGTNSSIKEIEHLEQVEQVILTSNYVFGNLKAALILKNPSKKFLFLDADIIVTNEAFVPFVQKELDNGKRLVLCVEGIVAKNETRRQLWCELENNKNFPVTNQYYNGGMFAGVFEQHKEILEAWNQSIHKYLEPGKYLQASANFPWADQDILNMTIQHMPEEKILAIAMPDWVGTATVSNAFFPCGQFSKPLFIHATGKLKTWLVKELPLQYPNAYDKVFYKYHNDTILNINSDLKFSRLQIMWLTESRLLPLFNKIRRVL